jgi:hypothetical protein
MFADRAFQNGNERLQAEASLLCMAAFAVWKIPILEHCYGILQTGALCLTAQLLPPNRDLKI